MVLGIWIGLCFVAQSCLLYFLHQQRLREEEKKLRHDYAGEPRISPAVNAIINEHRADREEDNRDKKGAELRENMTIVGVFITAALIAFQIYEMIKVYRPIQSQAIAAANQANAAIQALNDSNTSSERQLRAYVYARPYRAFHIDDKGGVAQIYTIIGSKGATFANRVERSVGIALLPGPAPERFEDLGPISKQGGSTVLAPDVDVFAIQNFRVITPAELAKLMTANGELRFYAFGKITYVDAFKKERQTTFCHEYFGPERLPFNGGYAYEHWQAKACDRHNEAD